MVLIEAIRDATWLTPERARAWCRILALTTALVVAGGLVWALFADRPVDPLGRPIGTDFLSFQAAAELALGGHPAGAYDPALHQAAQERVLGSPYAGGYLAFFNPPPFLLLVTPLATLPYMPALALWLVVTGTAYARAIGRLLPARSAVLAPFAFPAVLANLGHGQNGLLSASLFGFAAAWLDRRPIAAGVALGFLCYKPHLAVLVPVALAAGGRWRSFAAAAATVCGLLVASVLLLGTETWHAWLGQRDLATAALVEGLAGPGKMQSTFAAVRALGGSIVLATTLHGAVFAAVAIVLALVARHADGVTLGALLATASALASPYLFDYDLAILAVPLAVVFAAAQRTVWLPWEKAVLGLCFLLPLSARLISMHMMLPVTPLAVTALFLIVLRRMRAEAVVR